jgi:hypothetical protein
MRVLFDDGTVTELSEEEAVALYDELWGLVSTRGAVSAAGKLRHALLEPMAVRRLVLDGHETSAFTLARSKRVRPTA